MMGVSEMTVTRHVANDLAGKYRWVHEERPCKHSGRQVSAEWTQRETLQIIAWLAMCTLCADNYK
jgi:hypothetical protein